MRILLSYIAVSGGPLTHDYCSRFVGSYLTFPPGVEHETIVVCQGGPLPLETSLLFESLPCRFFPHENDSSWDIGAYIDIAHKLQPDMLVCCGETISFHRSGWLTRYLEAWNKYGEGMYGTFSSNLVRPHLNTTGFAVAPRFLMGSPRPRGRLERYNFEHGTGAMWRRIESLNFPVKCVTWDGEWGSRDWRYPDNILWKGDQSNLLMRCSHTDRYDAADEETKRAWEKGANGGFRI